MQRVHAALAWLVAGVVLAAAACPAAAAGAGRAFTITTKAGPETQVASVSPKGEALYLVGPEGQPRSGYVIDYATRTVTVIDFLAKSYQRLTVAEAAAFAAAERSRVAHSGSPYVQLPVSVHRPGRLRPLRERRRIKGIVARAWLDTRTSGDVSRLWFAASFPRPPAAIAKLMRSLAPPGGGPLVGNTPLLVEHRVGKRFHVETAASAVRAGVKSSAFRLPAGFHAAALVPAAGAKAASVPAHLTTGSGYFPEESRQRVFAVFQGTRFAHEPVTVARLETALATVITQAPYLEGLDASYGIAPGRIAGSAVVASNPDHTVGNDTNPVGYLNAFSLVSNAITAENAPEAWGRFEPEPPLIVIFVPEELVDGGGNTGYHSDAPDISTPFDPFGVIYLQVMPFAIVKVPPASDPGFIDQATKTLSHETVEAATDPVPTEGWDDSSKSKLVPPQQGEVADICHEPPFAPFGDATRVNGVEVSTYWDQALGTCFPESRPSVVIEAPASGATAYAGQQLSFRAAAKDPLDGALSVIDWSDGAPGSSGAAALGSGTAIAAHLAAGVHHVVAQATDSQGLTAAAQVIVNIVEPVPTAAIAAPADGSTYPSDRVLSLHGSGHDPVDGTLSGAALAWHLDGAAAPFATGGQAELKVAAEGPHTITLVATDSNGQVSAPATVHVTIVAPNENPSIHIVSPSETEQYANAETVPVSFTCTASDPVERDAGRRSGPVDR